MSNTLLDDIIEVGKEGTYDVLGFDETKSLMSNIHEHLDEINQQIAAEAETVKDEISEFDPGVMWTPLIISAMVMMGIFVISCCSVCLFCWYIRYNKHAKEKAKKAELEALNKQQQPVKMRKVRPSSRPQSEVGHYDQYDEESEYYYPERRRSRSRPNSRPQSKHIAINNFNEETYKIINHLHRTMSQQRDATLRREKNTENSRYDSSSSVHSMIIPPAGADIMRERQKEAALYPHLEDSLTGQHQFQKSV